MISQVLNILAVDEFYGVSENIEIAKGKYELVHSWKDVWYKIKRHWYGRRKN
jgi:hypothetical protein